MGSYSREYESYFPSRVVTSAAPTTSTRSSRASSVFSAYSDNDSWRHSSPARSLRSHTPRYNSSSQPKKLGPNGVHTQLRKYDGIQVPQENVIIKAGFSLMPPNVSRTTFKSRFLPIPAHLEDDSESARLSSNIKEFLKRSDHIEQDWASIHPEKKSHQKFNVRDKVNANIAIRGYQMSHSASWATGDGTDSSIAQNSDALSLMDVANELDEPDDASISVSVDQEVDPDPHMNMKPRTDSRCNLPIVSWSSFLD